MFQCTIWLWIIVEDRVGLLSSKLLAEDGGIHHPQNMYTCENLNKKWYDSVEILFRYLNYHIVYDTEYYLSVPYYSLLV